MSSKTITKNDLKAILEGIDVSTGGGAGVAEPTADTTAAFDSNAHINSSDMSAEDVIEFVDDIYNVNSALIPYKVDYIVEEGVLTNGGKYCKWNSGKAEFWYHTYVSTGVTTVVWTAPIYYGDYDTWSNVWAGVFNVAPANVICTSNNSQFISVIPYTYDVNGITNMRFISVGAKASVAYSFSLYVIGTWK